MKFVEQALSIMKGFKFMPTDQILVEHYLYNKIHGMDYFRGTVLDYDLYATSEPWQMWEEFNGVDGQDLYFFTQLKRSTVKSGKLSSHVNRKVGSAGGTWSAENSLTPVYATDSQNQIIGFCRRLRYENPQIPEHHGEWIMHEYSLHENYVQQNCACPNLVLCRIRKNERVKRKEEKVTRSTMTPMENSERSNKRLKNIDSSVSQPEAPRSFDCSPSSSFNESFLERLYEEPGMTVDQGDEPVMSSNFEDCEQSVVPAPCEPEMTTNQVEAPAPCEPEMTTNQVEVPAACEPEMTTNQVEVPTLDDLWKDLDQVDIPNLDELCKDLGEDDVLNLFDILEDPKD